MDGRVYVWVVYYYNVKKDIYDVKLFVNKKAYRLW